MRRETPGPLKSKPAYDLFFSSFGILRRTKRKKKEDLMYKTFEMELAGRTLRVDIGRVAKTGKRCSADALWRHYSAFHSNGF